jgi:hypothetical protein
MSGLRECPMCGGAAELGGKGLDRWAGACTNAECQTEGPMRKGREAATAAWNRRASPWRTMETAPRDGTDFLALIPWQRKHHQMTGCFARDGKFHSWPGRLVYHPTHWQPLPEPPEGV